jgi:hypothetical protein
VISILIPIETPAPKAALRVNDVLDVVMYSDVIPAFVGLNMEGHLHKQRSTDQVIICPVTTHAPVTVWKTG